MTQRILITGGAGFIGSRLSLALRAKGHEVVVLDNLEKQIHGEDPTQSVLYQSIVDKVHFIKGSVCDRETLEAALENIDTVVHYAAETGTGQSMYAIKHYVDVNVGATALLLDIIANKKTNVKKIVVASSRAIYGEGAYICDDHGLVYPESRTTADMENGDFELHCPVCNKLSKMTFTSEQAPAQPASIYGITKYNQEQMFLLMGKALGISAIAFRYQNVYGPGQSLSNPYTGILSIFSTRIRNGNELVIFEDGLESRDFVYIDDVVAATVLGIEHQEVIQEVFNVGSGVATDVLSLAHKLRDYLKSDIPIKVSGNFRLGDIRHNVSDLTRISKILGFKPLVSFDEGLKIFVNWVQGEKVAEDTYEQSIEELKKKGLYK
jgi:dTDP-L-rhamnose 4-epimerase